MSEYCSCVALCTRSRSSYNQASCYLSTPPNIHVHRRRKCAHAAYSYRRTQPHSRTPNSIATTSPIHLKRFPLAWRWVACRAMNGSEWRWVACRAMNGSEWRWVACRAMNGSVWRWVACRAMNGTACTRRRSYSRLSWPLRLYVIGENVGIL